MGKTNLQPMSFADSRTSRPELSLRSSASGRHQCSHDAVPGSARLACRSRLDGIPVQHANWRSDKAGTSFGRLEAVGAFREGQLSSKARRSYADSGVLRSLGPPAQGRPWWATQRCEAAEDRPGARSCASNTGHAEELVCTPYRYPESREEATFILKWQAKRENSCR